MRISPLLIVSALSLAALAGCSGHGQYTNQGRTAAAARVAGMKSANLYQQAEQSFLAGDLDKAKKTIDNSITVNPSVARSHILRGRILLEQGELEESANSLMRAEALDPKCVEAQYYLGIVYERFSEPEKALDRYKRAAELEPSNPQYAIATTEMLVDLGRMDEAEKYLTDRGTAFDHNAGARQTLAHIAMMRGDGERACILFNEARLLAPDDEGVLEDLTRAQLAAGHWGEAESNLAHLIKAPSNEGRRDLKFMQARCLVNLDRPVQARQLLLELVSGDAGRNDVDAWVLLGNTCYVMRDMNRVRMAYTNIVALAPDRADGYMLRALWQRKQDDLASALASVDKAVERRAEDVQPLMLKGLILRDMGKNTEARAAFEQALNADPKNEQARQAIATVPTDDASEQGGTPGER